MSRPEIILERYHIRAARSTLGAVCMKGKVEGRAAFPDQLVLMKDKKFYWIEFKSLTGTLQDDQVAMHEVLRKKGHTVYVCSTQRHSQEIIQRESM